MNEDYNIVISELRNNISRIISLYNSEKEVNKELKNNINLLEEELKVYKSKLNEVEKNYDNLKFAKVLEANESLKNEAKDRLNKIIREVENCIALINK